MKGHITQQQNLFREECSYYFFKGGKTSLGK